MRQVYDVSSKGGYIHVQKGLKSFNITQLSHVHKAVAAFPRRQAGMKLCVFLPSVKFLVKKVLVLCYNLKYWLWRTQVRRLVHLLLADVPVANYIYCVFEGHFLRYRYCNICNEINESMNYFAYQRW